MRRAIYPGSFDPITYGHLDVIERSSKMFDELIIGVLNNTSKNALFPVSNRVKMISELIADFDNVKVMSFDGLLVDFAKQTEANIIIRGLRMVTDFEYEMQIAQSNKVQMPELETVFLTTDLKYSYLSSSVVREFASFGGDIDKFVPPSVKMAVEEKYRQIRRD